MKGSVVKKGRAWYCVYRIGGKQKWKKGGETKRQAEKVLTEIVSDINQGVYKELKEIGFEDFSKFWLDSYAKVKCKASTIRSYEDIINKHLNTYFENIPLINISPATIQKYVSLKLSEGLSPKSVNNHLVPLKEMFKHAVIWGYLKESPALYVEKPRIERKEMDYLTPEELRLFLDKVTTKHKPLFFTAVLTGLRRGELLALKWGDIEFTHNLIYVRRALYKGEFISPKSRGSIRKVVMSPTLASVLKRYKLESKTNELDLVFTNGEGKPLDPDNLIRREFKPALRRAELRLTRFHTLRHSFVALLISQGENVKFIQSQLGHASIQTTLDRYGHLLPETHHEAGKRLDETLDFEGENGDFVRRMLENGSESTKKRATVSRNPLKFIGSGDRI
ncbi:MAG: site-specific integrase [Thermodesulfobacteriota bacterium]